MTEPGTGSDLQGIKTRAVKDGDHYILNGAKTFITNGINADLVIVVAQTDPEKGALGFADRCGARHGGLRTRPQARHRSVWMLRTPPNCPSPTSGCLRPTCWVKRVRASST
ncbi:acyl-CoA dehydrogenase family protein [Mycobacteroides abscessus]|uniref:acyl-CoA dehydrogenase family protein n=1 Tax=Mycobacteroides abscessus TaxID=36809 RepID=UPI0039A603A6